jgi:hypothetical protein
MRINPYLNLPIVRIRRLPAATDPLQWGETGDTPVAIVVFVIALLGAALGAALAGYAIDSAQHADDRTLLYGALAVLLPCLLALLAAIAEFTRLHTVSIDTETVHWSARQLWRRFEYAAPLRDYQGLFILDRTRRLFIRNQDKSLAGRRGPLTEFVIVLRHKHSGAFDLELFRAQPSLTTLLTMHSAAANGPASVESASACAELAASYRHALQQLCEQLDKPVLIAVADKAVQEWSVDALDDWLRPPSA